MAGFKKIATVNHIGALVPQDVAERLILERIRSRLIISESSCHLWPGSLNHKGYGQLLFRGKHWMVHRLVYSLTKGPIPAGHHVCHSCDVRNCCNPDHLWTGTNQENMVDASRKGRADRQWMTHCHRGHEFTPENTYYINTGLTTKRACRVCQRINQRIRYGWPKELAEQLDKVPPGYSHADMAQPQITGLE